MALGGQHDYLYLQMKKQVRLSNVPVFRLLEKSRSRVAHHSLVRLGGREPITYVKHLATAGPIN